MGRIWTFYISNDCTTIEHVYFLAWVTVACEIQLLSYDSNHASQSLSDMSLVHTFKHNLKTTPCIYGRSAYQMDALLSKTFPVWFRVA